MTDSFSQNQEFETRETWLRFVTPQHVLSQFPAFLKTIFQTTPGRTYHLREVKIRLLEEACIVLVGIMPRSRSILFDFL